ncbi:MULTISPECIES: winged helix-turn-helix domain-containing protein [unclassified Pseudomonas]|uniref:winged helix-turn-helix domain-containing protein n=1 Tax=unclassified Pseudomonas TaxID=196821 RepID=UPI001A9E782E|nr:MULTISPECIES: winged helix-turn-helix domain-containing protein [unclassified Pseudomonas]
MFLNHNDSNLKNGNHVIHLTRSELKLITTLLLKSTRIVSKEDLAKSLGKNYENYTGLEMCLSRLQKKFRQIDSEERLFRSVRNQGYCLVQIITISDFFKCQL